MNINLNNNKSKTDLAVNTVDIVDGLKYKWHLPNNEDQKQDIITFAQKYNLSFSVIQTLFNRGYTSKSDLDNYLFSNFEKDACDPSLLKDAEKAVDRLLTAIEKKEKILICGDYDVDGITSSAMILICLIPLGAKINYFLPNRVKDGYGLAVKTVTRAAKNGYNLLITVDNGITAHDPALEAKKLGVDLIITDHHKPHDKIPEAYAVVNPQQIDCPYPDKRLAGVGVTFKLMSLLYKKLNISLPNKVYELMLLGTIADVVPLIGENRFWVRHGLKLVNSSSSLPLEVLKTNAKFAKPALSSLDIGFFLAPQINALGRLEDARQGVRFLIGTDTAEVHQVGALLKELNQARKNIEKEVLQEVTSKIESKEINLKKERTVVSCSTNWPPGVIGLVASRLVSKYNRPTFLFHITSKNIAKGSCRSVPGLNIFEALQENKDILISFGGHAMAAGLALEADKLDELKSRLEKYISIKIPVFEDKAVIKLDAELSLEEINKKLVSDLEYLEPFGNENSQPIFYLKNVSLVAEPIILKSLHVKCKVFSDGVIKPIIFFNRPDIYEILNLKHQKDDLFSCVVSVMENHWNGRVSIELCGLDIAN